MKTKETLFPLLAVLVFVLSACSVDITEKQIPFSAKSFIKTHFPNETIDSTFESIEKDYYVLLSSGVELEFNHKGLWSEITANRNELPKSIDSELPEKMLAYLAENYPDSRIKKLEKSFPGSRMEGYRVRLSKTNNLEILFNKKGELAMKMPWDVKLPKLAQSFMDKYFPYEGVVFVELERNRNYRVYLNNGTQVLFDRKGTLEDLISKKRVGLPETVLDVLPKKAVEYIQENYPDQTVCRLTRKSYGMKVRMGKPDEASLCFSRVGVLVEDEFLE